ncbi:hypothetical protein [Flagellimonas meishanensis]|uniref:hypothetical protein n=1 Tax=Flagellimonas meishanensis TaxID=2873264 RepID=UPI001CA67AD3|nr:hypothetical protein [[Muricauda] meishanensis]
MSDDILRELRNHSNSIFKNLNTELSEVSARDFNEMLQASANRMTRERRTSSEDIRIAKEAYTRYINNLHLLRERRTSGKDIIRYEALNKSRSSLCPLWPIC